MQYFSPVGTGVQGRSSCGQIHILVDVLLVNCCLVLLAVESFQFAHKVTLLANVSGTIGNVMLSSSFVAIVEFNFIIL